MRCDLYASVPIGKTSHSQEYVELSGNIRQMQRSRFLRADGHFSVTTKHMAYDAIEGLTRRCIAHLKLRVVLQWSLGAFNILLS